MEDLYYNHGPWDFVVKKNEDLPNHTFMYELPITFEGPPTPNSNCENININNAVQMPFSILQKQGSQDETYFKEEEMKSRWQLIIRSLSEPINSCQQLELAIKKYNENLREFTALHHFFQKFLDDNERARFFTNLLPKIIKLALRLPGLIKTNMPILKQGYSSSISVSQLQVSSLLANAFLCTFPGTTSLCPTINFDKLFNSYSRPKRERCVLEKIKTLCHYFERVTTKEPIGVITFHRQYIPDIELPPWNDLDNNLKDMKIYVTCNGLIEDDSNGFLQVDFANRNVGGGVLAYGCVQEEIRFIISPELIVSRLFSEQLGPTEALIVTGTERFSRYSGYGDNYIWEGDYDDLTPFDECGRRRTAIVAIDAIRFTRAGEQYKPHNMLRELNKAYAGFYANLKQQLPPVATGNWGCGAYKGDPKLKSLLQMMVCNICNRDMIYFTFNDDQLCNDIKEMIRFLTKNNITVAQLWKYLCWFSETKLKPNCLYTFLQYIHSHKEKHSCKDFHTFTIKNMQNTKSKTKILDTLQVNCEDLIDNDISTLFTNL